MWSFGLFLDTVGRNRCIYVQTDPMDAVSIREFQARLDKDGIERKQLWRRINSVTRVGAGRARWAGRVASGYVCQSLNP